MLGLSEAEMYDSSPEFVLHRLNGYFSKLRWSEDREWERARMVAFAVAKSLGATKAKTADDFMEIGGEKKQRLTQEQIDRLKNL